MGSWSYGSITLYPGNTYRWGYTWHDDHGVSYAQPREFTGSTKGNRLKVSYYGTIRNSDGTMTYFVDIYNEGPQVATFELMGGTF